MDTLSQKGNPAALMRAALFKLIAAIAVIGMMLFLPAGTLGYWQAWGYCGVIFVPLLFVVSYLLKNDPGLIERRMRFREKEQREKAIVPFMSVLFLAGFLLPGFDHRFHWSNVPLAAVIAADVLVLTGYLLCFLVFRVNSHASRIVEVEKGQKVVTTGPYAIIRHPMYLGVMMMFLATPLALGSFVAVAAFIPLPFGLILRIWDEEALLSKNLPGYIEYCQRTRYRLLPLVW